MYRLRVSLEKPTTRIAIAVFLLSASGSVGLLWFGRSLEPTELTGFLLNLLVLVAFAGVLFGLAGSDKRKIYAEQILSKPVIRVYLRASVWGGKMSQKFDPIVSAISAVVAAISLTALVIFLLYVAVAGYSVFEQPIESPSEVANKIALILTILTISPLIGDQVRKTWEFTPEIASSALSKSEKFGSLNSSEVIAAVGVPKACFWTFLYWKSLGRPTSGSVLVSLILACFLLSMSVVALIAIIENRLERDSDELQADFLEWLVSSQGGERDH